MSKSSRIVNFPIYTIGDLSSGIYGIGPSILLLFYMTNILGIPIAIATVAAAAPKFLDLIFSPIIGSLSDRTDTRMGRRRPYLLASAILIVPLFLGIWAAPFTDPVLSAWFVASLYTCCSFCYAAFLVPYCALNSEITTTYNENSVLNSYRATYSMMGCLLAGAGAPILVDYYGGGRTGYAWMGVTVAAVMSVSMLITFLSSKEPKTNTTAKKLTFKETARAVVEHKPFMILLITYICHMICSGISGTALAYFITYVMEKDMAMMASFFFIAFSTSIAAIPLFLGLGKRIGKHSLFTLTYVISGLAALSYFTLDPSSTSSHAYAVASVTGLAEGAVQAFAYAMLADCCRHGDSRQGAMLSGVFIAGEKVAISLGGLVAGVALAYAGLVETVDGSVAQPDSAVSAIRLIMGVAPLILNTLGILVFLKYRSFDAKISESDTTEEKQGRLAPSN